MIFFQTSDLASSFLTGYIHLPVSQEPIVYIHLQKYLELSL